MIIKTVTQVGNPIIRTVSKRVAKLDPKVKKIIKDLTDSMRHHELVGMAAPQIGINLRIFVSEIRKTRFRKQSTPDALKIYINPVIVSASKKKSVGYEGCGSVAYSHLFGNVSRPEKVTVKALDESGNEFTLEAKGLLARIIQHELDHLDGKVFIDRMTETKSLMSK